jgi:DNA-binding transcriptional ArsR family regulator
VTVTLLIEEANVEQVRVGVSALAELCACLHAFNEPEHHPASRAWVERVRTAVGDDLLDSCVSWSQLWGPVRPRYFYPLSEQRDQSLGNELDRAASLPIADFVEMTGEALFGSNGVVSMTRLYTDPGKRKWFFDRLRLRSASRLELAQWLLENPVEFRAELFAFLERFAGTVFEHEWRQHVATLRGEAMRCVMRAHRDGLAFLGGLSTTASIRESPRRVVFDKLYHAVVSLRRHHTVVLPSVHVQPHLVIKHLDGWPVVIQYSPPSLVQDESLSLDDVHARLAALNGSMRAQLCRALARRPYSTAELAQDFGMAPEQVSRYLRPLRETGLARTKRQGKLVFYELDIAAVGRLGQDVLAILRR